MTASTPETPRPTAAVAAPVRLASPGALATAAGLGAILGPVEAVGRAPLKTSGRSGARHERLDVRLRSGERLTLVLKRNRLADDWEARRTGDAVGREAALLAEPALSGTWQVFRCPFRAFAVAEGEFGLLMDDLTAYLAPAGEAPIGPTEEEALLVALAALHARYWESDALTLPWLMAPSRAISCFRPSAPDEEARTGAPDAIFEWVRQGWAILFARLPRRLAALLARPQAAFARACAGLPRTLLHGNTRVGNFAYFPDGSVAAFDWAEAAAGPATLDLCWYLIINARRRARPAEEVMALYRAALEQALARALPDALWERMVSAGLLWGGAMLLWDRALDLDDGLPGAAEEWAWWVDQLQRRFLPPAPANATKKHRRAAGSGPL
jgi:hypothetical protein